jgi:signal peptidase II
MKIAALLISAIATVALDQTTKSIVARCLPYGRRVTFAPGSSLRRVTNVRASILSLPDWAVLLIWLAVVSCLSLVVARGSPFESAGIVGLGFVLGGATSNLIDRLTRGGVVDFIAIGRWPLFNLADAAMVAGTALAIWSLL